MVTNATLPQLFQASQGGPAYRDVGEEQPTELLDPLTNKQVFRKVINFGTLPNTAAATAAHGITNLDLTDGSWMRLEGWVTSGTVVENLALAANVTVFSVDATNINITTGADLTGSTGVIALEYTKT